MKKHWTYLKYVMRHKYYVFKAGLITKASLWALLIHDWSKFLPSEWSPYVNFFYGTRDQLKFDMAWNKHQKRQPHHWQYWVYLKDRPSTSDSDMDLKYKYVQGTDNLLVDSALESIIKRFPEALPIPEKYVREMVADWWGAGKAITGEWRAHKWYEEHKHNIIMHPESRKLVEKLMQEFVEKKGV